MPATVIRSREDNAETLDRSHIGFPAHENSSDFVKHPLIPGAPVPHSYEDEDYGAEEKDIEENDIEEGHGVEWREVAPLVDRFTNDVPAERKRRRGLHKRHRNFVMSGVFWVGLLFGIELVGLVFLYSIDLRAIRYEKSLQTQIDKTSLDIALAQNQLAASSSPAKLDVWAGQLGYHKAQLTEMDDVTISSPAPVAPTETP